MDNDQRIQQFLQMAQADPDNELGHFSLGKAYCEAGRFAEATAPLARAIEINARLSKAYQLLGEAHAEMGDRAKAIEVMTGGLHIADEQGDVMPRDAMATRLREWGVELPELGKSTESAGSTGSANAPTAQPSTTGFQCARCGQPAGQLDGPPFKGALGEKIHAHTCGSCWREWIAMGTKVINELGLALSTQAGQEGYDQYMVEFLQLEDR